VHSHSYGPSHGAQVERATPRVRHLLVAAMAVLSAATLIGLVLLWPHGVHKGRDVLGAAAHRERATIVDVVRQACSQDQGQTAAQGGPTCPIAEIRLTTGGAKGRTVKAIVPEGAGTPQFHPGDKVVVSHVPDAGQEQAYQIVDFQRGLPLTFLAIAFALVVVIAGRWRGLAALGGLVVSAAVLLKFIVPAILTGESPLPVAIVGSAAIMLIALFLTHGVTVRTAVAVLGTTASLALIGVLAFAVVTISHFSGLGSEEASFLRSAYGNLDLRGLLLAGIIIGSLGVLDDVTVTQTSTVWELAHANTSLSAREIYRAGVRVGRDHVASTVNTLVLAYAGASLPLLLLFTVSAAPAGDVLTTELVAQEVVRSLVGSIGIVAAVPVTTALATLVAVTDRGAAASRRRGTRARGRQPGRRATPLG
jgi:uncharacterized membrane protein